MPDTGLVWFGARETREAARVWISKATDASAVTKLARANDVLTQQVIALMEQVKELGALAEANANEAIKRGPGRPKGS